MSANRLSIGMRIALRGPARCAVASSARAAAPFAAASMFGFGATVVLVAMIATSPVSALRAGNAGNAEALRSVEQEFEGSQRVITAALREIASGVQYLESGA